METAAKYDERTAEAIVGPHQSVLDTETTAQVEGPGLFGEEGIGTTFDEESVSMLGPDRPTHPIGGIVDGEVDDAAGLARSLDDPVSGCKSGDAAADDNHLHECAGPILT